MINSSEITVVVKGLIVGKPTDKYKDRYTLRCIESVRKHLPDSRIILSTWENSDVTDINADEIILNPNIEMIKMLGYEREISFSSVNNQIITSQNGLEKVNTKYTLLIRSDMILTGSGFLRYFEKYNKNKCIGYLNKKVVVLQSYSPERVYKYKKLLTGLFDQRYFDKNYFNLPDWIYFGLTEDIKNIFDIPLMEQDNLKGPKVDGYHLHENNLSPEQYVWISFLNKYEKDRIDLPRMDYFSKVYSDKTEESYAKNTIMISSKKFGTNCLKYPGSAYSAEPWLSRGFYTLSEYKKIYNKYNPDKIFYIKNYFEEFVYDIQIRLRFFMKKRGKKIYRFIVNIIRKYNRNKDLLK